ncbi:MAG: polysaccharide biosynthesis tyrosine autokinase [Gemmatimonadaceae bacterium]|nr:polysaccharide biosynthesis tyrosine autokinase [Gemmatimonadaceae bacterium]
MPQYLPAANRRMIPAAAGAPHHRWSNEPEEADASLVPLDLREILAILRRRIALILGVTAVAAGIATYFALTAPPRYQAVGTMRLTDTRRQLTSGLVDAADNAPRMSSDPVLTEIAVLTSRSVVGHVVDSLPILRLRTTGVPAALVRDLVLSPSSEDSLSPRTFTLAFGDVNYTVSAKGKPTVRAAYGEPVDLGTLSFAIARKPAERKGTITLLRRDDAAAKLAGSIKAKPREGTDVIDVSYTSSDPVLAQHVINTLLSVFQHSSVEAAAEQARLRRQFIEGQLRQNDSLLSAARLALSGFRSREQSYSAKDKFTAERSDLSGIQAKVEEVDAQYRLYTSMLAQLQSSDIRGSDQRLGAMISAQGAAASPIVMDMFMQLQKLQNSRDSLTTGRWASASTNPDVQRIDAIIATTRQKLKQTVQTIVSTLDERKRSLNQLKEQSTQALVQIPGTDAEEARLVERESAYQKIADQLRDELQKARLAEAAEVGQVEIVDLASRAHNISTSVTQVVLFGVLLGLFLGSGGAVVIEHLDTSIRGRDDLETALQLPGLAIIPKFDVKGGRKQLNGNGAKQKNGNGRRGATLQVKPPSAQDVSNALITLKDGRSLGAEAYRTLRTKLLFSRAISSLKTIVVTSPFAQDGKSTVAANLATTFAQHGMRVLLMDCDLRRPTQHEIFHVPCEPGLTELIAGDGMVAGTGRHTAVPGLSLIPAGALPPDPVEVMGSARMREVLARLSESFDVVVLDTPPVLPVADSAILASMADGVLLVVRAGHTDRRAAQLAVQQLQDVDARILGSVLNDPSAQVPRYDEYGYATYYAYGPKA